MLNTVELLYSPHDFPATLNLSWHSDNEPLSKITEGISKQLRSLYTVFTSARCRMTMDDFITMRDKILQSNNICTSSYLGMVVYLGMVLDDRLILQGSGDLLPPFFGRSGGPALHGGAGEQVGGSWAGWWRGSRRRVVWSGMSWTYLSISRHIANSNCRSSTSWQKWTARPGRSCSS